MTQEITETHYVIEREYTGLRSYWSGINLTSGRYSFLIGQPGLLYGSHLPLTGFSDGARFETGQQAWEAIKVLEWDDITNHQEQNVYRVRKVTVTSTELARTYEPR